MDCTATRLPYRQTGYFSKTALDYIDQAAGIKPFFASSPTLSGIKQAIAARKEFQGHRQLLVDELRDQYKEVQPSKAVSDNIDRLLSPNTFTITTAHQNCIFTGPLYFIYKILHTVRVCQNLKASLPEFDFVPVFYMGSEDADLEELNHIFLNGEKLTWNTNQTGAVGRMKVDKELVKLIGLMSGQLGVHPFGKEIVDLFKSSYSEGMDLQTATFRLLHSLFAEYGLVVLVPDNARLKNVMTKVFEDDLLKQTSSGIVQKTEAALENSGYKVQANPREINLFYLESGIRERIVRAGDNWEVLNTGTVFSKDQLLKELSQHPERFSPNVILRGIYQETILPNIAFIGGGGELAYWLELKDLFEHYKVPYPVLLLRNSFLIIENKWNEKIVKLGLSPEDFFMQEQDLLNKLVSRDSVNQVKLNGSMNTMEQLYESFKQQAAAIDSTLGRHVEALKTKTVHYLQELEKKMLRAERRKFGDQQRQIQAIRNQLFPGNSLQERYDNMSYYYARWGKDFIATIFENSLSLEQEFVILSEK